MLKLSLYPICLIIIITILSCNQTAQEAKEETFTVVPRDCFDTFYRQIPIYKRDEVIRETAEQVLVSEPIPIQNSGKIYVYGSYLLINDKFKGIHIVDNSNPNAPENLKFIAIPGNMDIAMHQGIIYADNYMDLLTIDLKSILSPKHKAKIIRHKDAFSLDALKELANTEEGKGLELVLAHTEHIELVSCMFRTRGAGGGGQAGSMARFAVVGNYLYTIDTDNINVFDIQSPTKPDKVNFNQINTNGGILETVFPYENRLFIGSSNGMYIVDLTDPVQPFPKKFIGHISGCDPVVVEDTLAYVTIRKGTGCQAATNQLDIIDLNTFRIIKSYQLKHPHGLGVENGILYICQGIHGLEIYDAKDSYAIDSNLIYTNKEFDAYDLILVQDSDLLIVTGKDGIYQFDKRDPEELKLLSVLKTAATL